MQQAARIIAERFDTPPADLHRLLQQHTQLSHFSHLYLSCLLRSSPRPSLDVLTNIIPKAPHWVQDLLSYIATLVATCQWPVYQRGTTVQMCICTSKHTNQYPCTTRRGSGLTLGHCLVRARNNWHRDPWFVLHWCIDVHGLAYTPTIMSTWYPLGAGP